MCQVGGWQTTPAHTGLDVTPEIAQITNGRFIHSARYALAHLGIAGVGVGSFVFHATLDWYAQGSSEKPS